MTPEKLQVARHMYDSGEYSIEAIAKTIGASRASIYRHLTTPRTGTESRPSRADTGESAPAPNGELGASTAPDHVDSRLYAHA